MNSLTNTIEPDMEEQMNPLDSSGEESRNREPSYRIMRILDGVIKTFISLKLFKMLSGNSVATA